MEFVSPLSPLVFKGLNFYCYFRSVGLVVRIFLTYDRCPKKDPLFFLPWRLGWFHVHVTYPLVRRSWHLFNALELLA